MLRKFIRQAKRILHVARKPDKDEYLNIAKITGIGLLIIGIIGFIITFIGEFLGGPPG